MTNSNLKLIAIITMFIDHIGAILFPELIILRVIGRLAFPIFAFLLVEGCLRTSNPKAYLIRLGLFALVSEIPFDLAFHGQIIEFTGQNVFFTLFIGASMIMGINHIIKNGDYQKQWLIPVIVMIAFGLSILVQSDYDFKGIIIILLFYYFKDSKVKTSLYVGIFYLFYASYGFVQTKNVAATLIVAATFALPLISQYNNQRGLKLKYIFYVFYPLHLLVLFGISQLV